MGFHFMDFSFDFFCNPVALNDVQRRVDRNRQIDEHHVTVVAPFEIAKFTDSGYFSDKYGHCFHFIFVKAVRQRPYSFFENIHSRFDDDQANDEGGDDVEYRCAENRANNADPGADADEGI